MRSRGSSPGTSACPADSGDGRTRPSPCTASDRIVEDLDETLRDAMDDEWEMPCARSLATDLTAVLVAGVEALAAEPGRRR